MTLAGVDHIALPTSRPEAMISFYTQLGFRPVGVEEWRRGDRPIFALAPGGLQDQLPP
jgi:catechol 2,3-dioxygenase-like lactoylglutathione lyase family enzyme